jgi:hypothetical protein
MLVLDLLGPTSIIKTYFLNRVSRGNAHCRKEKSHAPRLSVSPSPESLHVIIPSCPGKGMTWEKIPIPGIFPHPK